MSIPSRPEGQLTIDDLYDDGMSRPQRHEKARLFVRACPLDAGPYDIATKLLEAGIKADAAETILRQEWGNRQEPPLNKDQARFFVHSALSRLWETARI